MYLVWLPERQEEESVKKSSGTWREKTQRHEPWARIAPLCLLIICTFKKAKFFPTLSVAAFTRMWSPILAAFKYLAISIVYHKIFFNFMWFDYWIGNSSKVILTISCYRKKASMLRKRVTRFHLRTTDLEPWSPDWWLATTAFLKGKQNHTVQKYDSTVQACAGVFRG